MPYLDVLKSRWLHYGLLMLVCVGLWARGNVWEGRAQERKAAYEQLVTDTRTASEEAARLAAEAKKTTEDKYAQIARQADAARADLQDMRARNDRYAIRNRVHAPAGCTPGPTTSAAGTDAPASGDGPGATPELVAIPRADFDLIGVYVDRLTRVRDWSQKLRDEGFAVVSTTEE